MTILELAVSCPSTSRKASCCALSSIRAHWEGSGGWLASELEALFGVDCAKSHPDAAGFFFV